MSHALAESTWNTYRVGVRRYVRFCRQLHLPALPFDEDILQMFVTSLSFSVSVKTIRVYLCGVQAFARIAGHRVSLSDMVQLDYLLLGIRRVHGDRFRRRRRAPITLAQLRSIIEWVGQVYSRHDAFMLSSAVTLAFFGLLRVSEYTCPTNTRFDPAWHLSVDDVTFHLHRRLAYITIKASKTDPFRESAVVRVGMSGGELCPVTWLVSYLGVRRGGRPLYLFEDGRFLTRRHVSAVLQGALGSHANVNTHSFRIGGASALAGANVPAYQIQILGRWRSDAFLTYIRLSDEHVIQTAEHLTR